MSVNFREYFQFTLLSGNKYWAPYFKEKSSVGVYSVAVFFFSEFLEKLDGLGGELGIEEWETDLKKKLFPDSKYNYLNSKDDFSNKCLKLSEEHDQWDWGDIYEGLLVNGESCLVGIPGHVYLGSKVEKDGGKKHNSAWHIVYNLSKTDKNLLQGFSVGVYAEIVKHLFKLRYGVAPETYDGEVAEYFLPGMNITSVITESSSADKKETTTTDETTDKDDTSSGTGSEDSSPAAGDEKNYYVVTIADLKLRKSDSSSGAVITSLNKGIIGEYIKTGKKEKIGTMNDCWIKLKISDNLEGWCYGYYLEKLDTKNAFIVIEGTTIKKRNVLVFIDPGHRNSKWDSGNIGINHDWKTFEPKTWSNVEKLYGSTLYKESSLVLDVALELKKQLETKKYEVKMTRSNDSVTSLSSRSKFVNDELKKTANKDKIAIFISVHTNSVGYADKTDTTALKDIKAGYIWDTTGEIYCYKFDNKTSSTIPIPKRDPNGGHSYTQKDVYNSAGTMVNYSAHPKSAILSKKISEKLDLLELKCTEKTSNLKVLRETTSIPGILLELGFSSNIDNLKFMIKMENQKKICTKILEGIDNCFK